MKSLIASAVACATLAAFTAPAAAQVGYFGQNKVQYQNFDFRVLKTEHFDIYYYLEEKAAAEMAGRMAERWYVRLATVLDHRLKGRQVVVLYGSGTQFRQTNVVEGDVGEGTGGVTEAYKRRIVLPLAGPIAETDHVLGHELVHAFQYDMTNTDASSAAAGSAGALALPLWFIEGMAEYLSIGPDDPNTAMWMRDATRREKLPDIDDLQNPKYFPYRYGEALWAYIGGRYGDRVIGNLLRVAAAKGDYKAAFKQILGISSKDLSKAWHDATMASYRPIAESTRTPESVAQGLIVNKSDEPGYNTSPELSPDGSRMAFFSSRDLFSIDLYIADAATGRILRKLTNTATNAHLDSISFIDSAGAWSSDGRRFVFPAVAAGHPILRIVDAGSGATDREIDLKGLDDAITPTWAPDDHAIAFTAMIGGYQDLYIYDLRQNALRRLTNDPYADMQPSWSPDGRTIAFSTDQFTTNIRDLHAGNLQLALLDVASGEIHPAGGFDGAKNINPKWAGNDALYFVSDRLGISNVYRLDLASHTTTEITNLLGGASGITALSPALGVSKSRVAFSVYQNDSYNIYTLDTPDALAGSSLVGDTGRNAGILPPRRTGEGIVYAYLHNDAAGLPAPSTSFPTKPYSPRLSLDYLGQPVVGVGVDSFGTYVGGGISAVFSDVLGNHMLGADVQMTNRFDEAGGTLVYLNRTHRWNWGASLDQTPYVIRGFTTGLTETGSGQPLIQENEYRQVQTDRGVSGMAIYPFSRAERVEFSTGFRQITGKTDVTTRLYDYYSGQQLTQDTTRLSTFPTLNLGIASGALVHDTSIFGATSPIEGSRYRLEYDQTYDLGANQISDTLTGGTTDTLTYGAVLADYRRYMVPVRPFTVAVRGLFYGRYGAGAESTLLTPVFIGYPDLVRGYDYGSFNASECGPSPDGSCPALDRLIGSRMMILNAELRFPPWGVFGGSGYYGPLPLEVALFADGGAAFDSGHPLTFSGANQNFVKSVGAAARINVLGFAVAEIDYVHPLDRLGRGWMWEFNLRPGF